MVKYGDIVISEDEESVLRLHPKMAVTRVLEENFLSLDQDLSYAKLRMTLHKEAELEEEDTADCVLGPGLAGQSEAEEAAKKKPHLWLEALSRRQ